MEDTSVIYDHRTYTCRPGTIKKQLALYAENGWKTQRHHLGDPVIFAATETGDVNSYIHVWVYKDAADREQRRARLQQDPDWIAYLKLSAEAGNLISQVNKILTPTPFFPS
ncbi:NIPSNAP family protein [Paracoccus aestuariivivens]|uniref:NIPSNAP family protein n=1 Tax=Paracoccus aestuariivivens TaxID=1820333 RepID=UPI001FE94111|nr:NIPSNAP family protein [Paracoccus aestuariivivens]